ncbi:hypothetical protein C461_09547 [Halorubrum aidingense JCM 13560]|uniref:Uncharacterized protein n=1 Tax=Halorubrum aidingense JCM 13560 TaxID=1230454 RepID=M0PA37_9EURY|nr:hypothetical protein [Halorubrum aidingense]EMA66992.1 hypothetical protein C461_09547 [Halorubrum aidingense JCM 13560]
MQRTRRGLLGAGVAAVGFAGCLGVDGVEYPDEADDDPPSADPEAPDGDGSSDTSDGDSDDSVTDQDDDLGPHANEALAAATRAVVDDAVWFATEYPDAVASYRAAVRDVVAEIDAVRAAVDAEDAVAASMADRLAAAGRGAADRAADALEPHFRPRARIVSRTDRHVEPLRRFGRRGDVDRFLESLSRMRSAFAGLATATYTDEAFSRDPVHNRLLDRLLAPFPEDGDRRSDARDTLFVELAVPTRGFATFAHRPYDTDRYDRSRIPRIYGTAVGADRREELRARLGPIPRPGDRTEEVFAAFASRPPAGASPRETFEGWAHELDGTPVYVQRYPDSETAARRLTTVLDEAETEGRAPIDPRATAAGSNLSGSAGGGGDGDNGADGGDDGDGDDGSAGPTRWHRLYHHEATGERYGFDEHAGVQYGYVVQAGEFLLAAGFSGDAWEERAGWQRRLADGWVVA